MSGLAFFSDFVLYAEKVEPSEHRIRARSDYDPVRRESGPCANVSMVKQNAMVGTAIAVAYASLQTP